MKSLSFREYCKEKNLDITGLNDDSIQILAFDFLEGYPPSQYSINRLAGLDNNRVSAKESINQIIEKYSKYGATK